MSLYKLDIGWATTASGRRHLHWELLAHDQVLAAFQTARADVLAVLFDGERFEFREWARSLAPEGVR